MYVDLSLFRVSRTESYLVLSFGQSMEKASQYKDLIKAIKNLFVAGAPVHTHRDCGRLSIFVIPDNEMKERSVQECQTTLRHQHLLITKMINEPMDFDEGGLETVKSVDTVIDIYGQGQNSLSIDFC